MHIESTIELIESIKNDILHNKKNYQFTRVYSDFTFAIESLEEASYYLRWAKKHLKELEED